MAWAEQLPSGNWRACWRDLQGRKRGTVRDPVTNRPFTKESHASRVAGSKEDDARRGIATADGKAPKWSEWLPYWLEARVVEPSTARQDLTRINRYLTPKWGERRLNTITRREVQLWANALAREPAKGRKREIGPTTIQRILHLFSASMHAAVLDERVPLTANPCTAIEIAPATPGAERYLTREEVDRIAHYLNEPYKTAWLILCGTGLRFGELAGLHWNRVNLDQGSIAVVEAWDAAAAEVKPYPKSKKPRSVPIPSWLRPVLEAALANAHTEGCGLRHRRGVICRSSLVVPAARGGALDGHNFGRRDFATAVELAKVEPCRLHDARHTYASWLRQAGIPLETIQDLLGHASIITTQRYAHLGNTQNAAVKAALDATSEKTKPRARRGSSGSG